MDWSHYFVYDENSGNLIWKVKPCDNVMIGDTAGLIICALSHIRKTKETKNYIKEIQAGFLAFIGKKQ